MNCDFNENKKIRGENSWGGDGGGVRLTLNACIVTFEGCNFNQNATGFEIFNSRTRNVDNDKKCETHFTKCKFICNKNAVKIHDMYYTRATEMTALRVLGHEVPEPEIPEPEVQSLEPCSFHTFLSCIFQTPEGTLADCCLQSHTVILEGEHHVVVQFIDSDFNNNPRDPWYHRQAKFEIFSDLEVNEGTICHFIRSKFQNCNFKSQSQQRHARRSESFSIRDIKTVQMSKGILHCTDCAFQQCMFKSTYGNIRLDGDLTTYEESRPSATMFVSYALAKREPNDNHDTIFIKTPAFYPKFEKSGTITIQRNALAGIHWPLDEEQLEQLKECSMEPTLLNGERERMERESRTRHQQENNILYVDESYTH